MKLLSVIIPTYNMEKYLKACLESFIEEDNLLFDEIEVLIINDGSKDRSAWIAKKFAKRYPDIFRVIDKENGGHGSAINCGIKAAVGKYFRVVDADDWVDTKEFYKFLLQLKEADVDIVFTSYSSVDEKTGQKMKFVYNTNGIIKGQPCPIDVFLKNRIIRMHSITYRTKLLKQGKIHLDEHCFYVDTEYVIYPLKYVEDCLLINANVYRYRVNTAAQSCSDVGYYKHKKDHEKVALNLLKFVNREIRVGTSNAKKKYYYRYVSDMLQKQYRIYLMEDFFSVKNKKELKIFDNEIKRINPFIYQKLSKSDYIKELREFHFCFILFHKWKFKILKNIGEYPGLDF